MKIKDKTSFVIALGCAVCLFINITNQKDAFVIGVCAVAAVGNLIFAYLDV